MPKAMMITVGTGRHREDIAGSISFSIKRENPNRIFFLVTPKSKEETLPLVVEKIKEMGFKESNYKVLLHEESDDIQELYVLYGKFFMDILEEDFSPIDIVIDYTSGTKAMSAALFSVAIEEEISGVNYISGNRDKGGRVIPGTEKQVSPNLTKLRWVLKLKKLPELFNYYQFEACHSLLNEFESKIDEPSITKVNDFLSHLVKAYMLWDRFDLEGSMNHLKHISHHHKKLLEANGLDAYVEVNKKLLHREKEDDYSIERLVDLYTNAERRYKEGKYDDCTARIYRAFEYMAQYMLFKNYGIRTKDLRIENLRGKLSEDIISEYEKLINDSDGEIKLGLVESYSLLEKLGDELGKKFRNEFSDNKSNLKKYLNIRNQSILAHGFTSVGKASAEKFIQVLESYLDLYITDWKELYRALVFPELKDVKWF